jgi:hypothetical protein
MILRWNKIPLPPMSTWTRGLNKMLLTPAPMPAALKLLRMSAQATKAPAQTREKAPKCQRSEATQHQLLRDKLRRPRQRNQRPRLWLRRILLLR